ncbi:ABC transporter permease [Methylobacterium sp. Leaf123]|uniref:ABC transporter permease n=1 Tax=Methylobacterium sp. Leaf123 TaxID=1736264 RepID=UPI0006FED026|nr:ABC transporter permease [Methylobacterium sp. Leaf123]KQQ14811.1 ABC transporter permease [Methylobacterium sp. Leaf123]
MTAAQLQALPLQDAPPTWTRRLRGFGAVLPALVFVLLLFVVPVLALLLRSITEPTLGLGNYAAFFAGTTYLKVLGNTFLVASLVTGASLVIGFPTAWFLAIAPRRLAGLLAGIVVLSMWTNLLARTYAWMVLLQGTGLINRALLGLGLISAPLTLTNNLIGVTLGMTYIMLPFMVLPLTSAMRTIDPSVLQAASLCGATRWQCLTRILLPMLSGPIASGALMIFVMSLGYFVTPALLGGTANMMLPELIAQLVQSLLDWGLASTAATILLVLTLILYSLQVRFFGTRSTA